MPSVNIIMCYSMMFPFSVIGWFCTVLSDIRSKHSNTAVTVHQIEQSFELSHKGPMPILNTCESMNYTISWQRLGSSAGQYTGNTVYRDIFIKPFQRY